MTKDLSKGNSLQQLTMLSLPMILGSLLQQLYLASDAFIVGNFINSNALGAIGAASAILFLLIAFLMGMSMGLSVVISQYFGAKDYEKIKTSIATAIVFLFLLTLVVSFFGFLASDFLLEILNTPKDIISESSSYLKYMFIGLIFMFLFDVYFSVLYGLGNTKVPLYILFFTLILNIVLDIVFIVVFKMGIEGVAIATTIAQFVSAIITIFYVNKKIPQIALKFKDLKIQKESLKILLKFGIPSSLQQSILFFSLLLIQSLVNSFGTNVIAGYTAASRIDTMIFLPYSSISIALSVFVGQNMGAGKFLRTKEGLFASFKLIGLISVIFLGILWFFGAFFVKLFLNTSGVPLDIGTMYLMDLAPFYILLGFTYMFLGLLRGAGDNNWATIIIVISLLARVTSAYILVPLIHERGLWLSAIVGWFVAMVVAYLRYRGEKWRKMGIA